MSVEERYVLFGQHSLFCFVFIPIFENQELSVNIQIPSLPEKTQKVA